MKHHQTTTKSLLFADTVYLALSFLRVDSKDAGDDVHGDDEEADDHRFNSRHGFCNLGSPLLSTAVVKMEERRRGHDSGRLGCRY